MRFSRHAPRPRWWLAAALALWSPAGRAETTITIDATVGADLASVTGTFELVSDTPFSVVDPLAALPTPTTDELIQATFPGAPSTGSVQAVAAGPTRWTFTTRLPRRYGDIGSVAGHGLFANGGWYPLPVDAEGLPRARWDVTVTLPPGAAGALGDQVGAGSLHWVGTGERASLAVVPRGVVTAIEVGGVRIDLLTRGPPRRLLVKLLGAEIPGLLPVGGPQHGVVVEAPLRRQLSRPGNRLTYLSDRAWRLTPGLRRFHDVAVLHGVANALLAIDDPFARDIAASASAARYRDALAGTTAADALRWVAWIPFIDKMLHGKHTPFLSEILEEALPGDPVRDDLVEVFDPHWPGSAVVAQLDDRYGPGTGGAVGRALEGGIPLRDAAVAAGVDPAWLDALRVALPVQDYVLDVDRAGALVTITREAPAEAPVEAVTVQVDGAPQTWIAGPGPDTLTIVPPEPARKVAVDPGRHVAQTSTARDTWPARFTPVVAAGFSRVDLRQLYFEGFLQVALRRQYDTRWVWRLRAYADESTLVGGEFGYVRMFGPEVDGLRREHQVWVGFSPALLSARYASTAGSSAVLGAEMEYVWDTTVARYFPLRGHRLAVGVDGGVALPDGAIWQAVRAEALVYLSPHPRVSFPLEALAGASAGAVEHRLVDLGGLDGMRSLPPGEVVGVARGIGRVEARWAFMHNAAVPLLLLWGNELSVSAGFEAGTAVVEGRPVGALGATAGVGWQVALFGADPSYARVRMGYPLRAVGFDLIDRKPQIVFEAEQPF